MSFDYYSLNYLHAATGLNVGEAVYVATAGDETYFVNGAVKTFVGEG